MKNRIKNTIAILATTIAMFAAPTWAVEMEGRIQSVDLQTNSFFVNGAQIFLTEHTQVENFFYSLKHLNPGMHVEVNYYLDNGRLIATEIELDD